MHTIEDWTSDKYDLFFDASGVLNLKPVNDSKSLSTSFQRGKNALLITDESLKAFPSPLSYGKDIEVNKERKRITGLLDFISPQNSLMEVLF